ncbi:Retrovirus-related Pol polyprotein from transposon RE2 [Vitis vinifera]|uniref:Retrovirus-related Pol polyprotein from transposon RE2 n=1 Tax=Vitis vinifera TaxID=29760 RepID=A0A438HWR3_VITVI|nr:Retrovirus-related Pol polyprotein from transposon RE2 [Vitis vinifera]
MPFCMASYLKKYTWIFHQDAWCQKSMSEGVQIEEVIVWVEAIPENMVWKVHKVNESFWLSSNHEYFEVFEECSWEGNLFAKNVDHQSIEVYTDADWAGAVDDMRSTSGYFTFVGGNLVRWKSKKQNVVARSSAEAEFRGMSLGLCEAYG